MCIHSTRIIYHCIYACVRIYTYGLPREKISVFAETAAPQSKQTPRMCTICGIYIRMTRGIYISRPGARRLIATRSFVICALAAAAVEQDSTGNMSRGVVVAVHSAGCLNREREDFRRRGDKARREWEFRDRWRCAYMQGRRLSLRALSPS